MDNDKRKRKIPSICVLKITEGIDKGKIFHLHCSQQYTIGRAKDCEIIIDQADRNASRRHALLTVEKDNVMLENLSQTNPTIVNGKKIHKIRLKKGGQFQVGSTLFELEGHDNNGSRAHKYRLKPLTIAAGLILMLAAGVMIVTRQSTPPENAKPPVTLPEGKHDEKSESAASDSKEFTFDQPASDEAVTIFRREEANEHFRQGMFFYNADRLKKAIDEWDRALVLDRTHPYAKKWLLRAEDELEGLISKHYQRALISKKYMRYNQAINEFRIVIELSRNKEDERYANSLKQLQELEGR